MRKLKGGAISAMARLIEDIAWILLLLLVPWSLFNRFLLPCCIKTIERRVQY